MMKAIVMLGGEGRRLRPLTSLTPKPMVNILDKPVLGYVIELLKKHNITDYGFAVRYLSGVISDYYKDGSDFGVNVTYFHEDTPLGTAGGVKNCQSFIDTDNFLVISGDCLTDIDLTSAVDFHKQKNSLATLVMTKSNSPGKYGIITTDDECRITNYFEKPSQSEIFSDNINTGIYIFKKEIFDYIPEDTAFDFSNDLFPLLISQNLPFFASYQDGYWCDIGNLEQYLNCHRDILDKKYNLSESAANASGVITGENVFIEIGAKVKPPVFIGDNTYIEKNAEIMPYSVISRNSRVEEAAMIENSVILNNARIMKNAEIYGAIVGSGSTVGQGAKLHERSVLGEYIKIGREAVVKPNVTIGNDKYIENNTVISEDIMNGSLPPEIKFSENFLLGDAGFDLTPETAIKIGSVYGCVNGGAPVGVFSDDNGASEMIADAINAGLKSVGAAVYGFTNAVYPICKNTSSFYSLGGGVFVYTEDNVTFIEFFDKDGANISRKTEAKIESTLSNKEIPKVDPSKIQKSITIQNYKFYYYSEIVKKLGITRLDSAVIFEKSSQPVLEYLRKIALAYNLTLIPTKKALNSTNIRVNISPSGKRISLWDENGTRLTQRQIDAIIAVILIETGNASKYIASPYTGDAIRMLLNQSDVAIEETRAHASERDRAMLRIPGKEQFFMTNDPVYLLVKIMFYLKNTKMSLYELTESLPKTFFVEKTINTHKSHIPEAMSKLTGLKNSEALSEGVKFKTDKGSTYIVADNKYPKFKIISESGNEEYAAELTDFYSGFLGK